MLATQLTHRMCRPAGRSARFGRTGRLLAALTGFATVVAAGAVGAIIPATAAAEPAGPPARTAAFVNPTLPGNVADPDVIKGMDGYYYLYATTTTLGTSSTEHILPIWRSRDMVHWSRAGDALAARPDWAYSNDLWAPDVHFFNGQYYLYYTADKVKALPRYGNPSSTGTQAVSAIGVAVGPTPVGPFTDAGPSAGAGFAHGPVVAPSWGWCTDPKNPGCYNWHFDSNVVQDADGQRYLYEGSYFGGTRLWKLAADGLSVDPGSATQVGHQLQYEASSMLTHDLDGHTEYYMLNSRSDCCSGANSPYSEVANRGNAPWGNLNPDGGHGDFSDQNGSPMEWSYGPVKQVPAGAPPFTNPIWWNLADEGGGYPVLQQNGNGTVGAGGASPLPDLAGQQWLVYHGINEAHPWQAGGGGSSDSELRQLYLDPLQWTPAGWPTANGDGGPSLGGAAPVTIPLVGSNFNGAGGVGAPDWTGSARPHWKRSGGQWSTTAGGALTGGVLQQTATTGTATSADVRPRHLGAAGFVAQADVRAAGGTRGQQRLAVSLPATGDVLTAAVDGASRTVTLTRKPRHGAASTASAPLPASFDPTQWSHLVLTLDTTAANGPALRASLQNPDGDPLGTARLALPASQRYTLGALSVGTQDAAGAFDNVTLAARTDDRAPAPTAPATGRQDPAASDSFGNRLGGQWGFLREDPALHGWAPTGALRLTSNGTLDEYPRVGNPSGAFSASKNVLLQNAPAGNWMVETKLHFDPQSPSQEAGLLAYSDDDTNVVNGVTWSGNMTQVESKRNALAPRPAGQACPLAAPMPGARTSVGHYTSALCPATSDHTSQEAPASLACCFVGNAQGPSADGTYAGGNADPSRITVWLRLYKDGDVYTPYLSHDGRSWQREDAWTLHASGQFPVRIGLFASDNGALGVAGAQAWFDYVHVYRR